MSAVNKEMVKHWLVCISLVLLLPPSALGTECASASSPEQPSGTEIRVESVNELQRAVRSAQPGSVILLAPGGYKLTATAAVGTDDITIRGEGDTCIDVFIMGAGMNNPDYGGAPHGIWTDASGLTVQNLTIRDFYQHGIVLNPGAESPTFQNIRIVDTGKPVSYTHLTLPTSDLV